MKFVELFHRPNAGLLLLRWGLAVIMLFHGYSKIIHGVGGIEGMLAGVGLPSFVAYGAYIGEVLAPLLLLAGVLVVPAALAIAVNMVFAISLAHLGQLFTLNAKTGGLSLELQFFFMLTAIVVALTAPKAKSLLK